MNWTTAELSPKFSLETMHWELSLYPFCPDPLSFLNFSASLICCLNTRMCRKRSCPEMASYFNWKPVKFNFQWPCCFLTSSLFPPCVAHQCFFCLCTLGGSRDSHQDSQHVYIAYHPGIMLKWCFLWWISSRKGDARVLERFVCG